MPICVLVPVYPERPCKIVGTRRDPRKQLQKLNFRAPLPSGQWTRRGPSLVVNEALIAPVKW